MLHTEIKTENIIEFYMKFHLMLEGKGTLPLENIVMTENIPADETKIPAGEKYYTFVCGTTQIDIMVNLITPVAGVIEKAVNKDYILFQLHQMDGDVSSDFKETLFSTFFTRAEDLLVWIKNDHPELFMDYLEGYIRVLDGS